MAKTHALTKKNKAFNQLFVEFILKNIHDVVSISDNQNREKKVEIQNV